ncbi:MAG: hydroxymethylbilane synthase [Chloroflexi bacterium]|nr:hydroxymethylbilane synthase [Chloroflexota bacterium]
MTALKRIVVGTRGSTLALYQTEEILKQLSYHHPDTEFVVSIIHSRGDREREAPLLSLGKGIFVSDIETALLEGEIDLAVHSLKDLLSTLPPGLTLGAIGQRLDPRDVLVNRWGVTLDKLPLGAKIGTSSPRREALIRSERPDIQVVPIRGNVDTRLEKAKSRDYDGVVLAAAGIMRLDRQEEISEYLPPQKFIPAVGQGALAVEIRSDDEQTLEIVSKAEHPPTRIAVNAERAFLQALGGGCKVPLAAYGEVKENKLFLYGMAATVDGPRLFRAEIVSDTSYPVEVGQRLAQELMDSGAREIIETEEA